MAASDPRDAAAALQDFITPLRPADGATGNCGSDERADKHSIDTAQKDAS
jgi:hypothetical protein